MEIQRYRELREMAEGDEDIAQQLAQRSGVKGGGLVDQEHGAIYSQLEETDAFRITVEPITLDVQRDAGPSRCARDHLSESQARGHNLDIAHSGIGHPICTRPAKNLPQL